MSTVKRHIKNQIPKVQNIGLHQVNRIKCYIYKSQSKRESMNLLSMDAKQATL